MGLTYYLAIDIGASSGRHILGWLEDGILKTQEIYRFQNGMQNNNNRLLWDTDTLFKEIKEGLKKAKSLGKIPSYIGIDTWAVDYALLDEKDKLIGEVYAYRDKRTENTIQDVQKRISFETCYDKQVYNINRLIQFISFMKINYPEN